jgi:hypothetical protein
MLQSWMLKQVVQLVAYVLWIFKTLNIYVSGQK